MRAGLEGAERVVVLPLQRNLDEDIDAEADRTRIDDGAVAANDATCLQRLQAAGAGRWRKADASGKFDRRQAAVACKGCDDFPVEVIQMHEITDLGAI